MIELKTTTSFILTDTPNLLRLDVTIDFRANGDSVDLACILGFLRVLNSF